MDNEQTRSIREWVEVYRLWNEQERAGRQANAGRESVEEKLASFFDLCETMLQIAPQKSGNLYQAQLRTHAAERQRMLHFANSYYSADAFPLKNRLLEALQRAARFLEREGIPFVIIGGLANAVWGEPRATRDVDIKVYVGERTAQEFAALVAREFAPATPVPDRPTLVISIAVLPDVTVDFLIAIPGYEENVLARAQSFAFGEMTLPVCSPEDFVIHKVIADRSKDWADVEGVLIEQGDRLDQEYIRTWLAQFAEILERPDWLDRYENLVRQFMSAHDP